MTGKEKDRAKKLAAKSQGNIKAKRLLSVGTGILKNLTPGNYLHDKPILDYFKQDEQPHYFFYNESEGVQIGNIRKKSGWSGTYRNSMWITNKGLHFTVGESSGDFHYFLPFSSIQSVEIKSGLRKNKFTLETDEGKVRFSTAPTLDVDSGESFILQNISTLSSADKEDKATDKKQKGTYAARKEKTRKKNKSSQPTENTSDISLSTLQQMDAYDFEHLIARVWEKQGWETEVSTGSTDKGVDVTAVKKNPFEQRQYIQVKRYAEKNKVGSGEIQKYSGLYARNESVDAVIVVTTSEFTREAEKVSSNRNVKLINGDKLINLINDLDILINKYI